MPRLKKEIEVEEEFDDEEDEEDELEEEEADVEAINLPRVETRGRKPKPKEIKRRFGIMAPQPLRIVDIETNEVIGEGEPAIIQALTDIIERLERIEVQIGTLG